MEDSGYFSHRSNEFKFSGGGEGDSGRIPSPEDLFKLTFDDLGTSCYSYLRYGFKDEEDFEDFKQELQEFRRLRRGVRGGVVDGSLSPRAGRNERNDEDRCVDSESIDTIKVSTAASTREKRTGERGQSNGTERHVIEGDSVCGEGHGECTAGTGQSRSPSLLKRSVSLRAHGGGPRARVNKNRNGIYFADGDGFLSEPPHCVSSRVSRAHASCEAGNKPIGHKVSGPVTNTHNNRKLLALESVPPEQSSPFSTLERTPTLSRSRKQGVREIPDTSVSDESCLPKENCPCSLHHTSSLQNAYTLASKSSSSCVDGDCGDGSEQRSTQGCFSLDVETWPRKDSNNLNEKDSCIGLERLSENSKHQIQQHYLPLARRAQCVCLSVSPQNGHLEAFDDDTSVPDQLLEHCSAERDQLSTINCPSAGPEKCTTVRGRPPKVPVSTSDQAGKAREKKRAVRQENHVHRTQKNGGIRSESDTFHGDDEQIVTGTAIPEGKTFERRQSQLSNAERSSLLLQNLKRLSSSGRPPSGRDLEAFMDFFNGDEHYQEFERVFETIKNRRFSCDGDAGGAGVWWREDGSEEDPTEEDHLNVLYINETFLDFFDNDEDFKEFERELEKIKSNRRSKLLGSLSRCSSCDIFSDIESFSDRNLNRRRTPSSSPKVERRLSATNSSDCDLWNSAEEWSMVMRKLRRNSRLFTDQAGGNCRTCEDSDSNPTGSQSLGSGTDGHLNHCQCVKDCQYTCHSNCVPSVALDCTVVSPGSTGGPVATPSDLPSPYGSVETSLTERQTLVTYKSPQKQQQQCAPNPTSQTTSQSVPCLLPPGGAKRVDTPPRDVSSSSETDPLLGTCVSQTAGLSSSSSSSSVCVARDLNQNAENVDGGVVLEGRVKEVVCDAANEKDETDSGYRSGTIPDEKLPKAPSQATLDRKELRRKIETFNHFVPKASLEVMEDGIAFQGFLKVTLNLVRPITMELGARPPSIYELLTREHIVEQSTQHIAFYMPRDTVKSIHITSKTTTREVITSLLKKFHIIDNPRKFAMYEQEFNEKNKLVKLRRLTDKDFPLVALLSWKPDNIKYYRLVLQENETGEIVWDAFSTPELKNFMIVLDREENEAITQLQYKYRVMKRIIVQRMKELRHTKNESTA